MVRSSHNLLASKLLFAILIASFVFGSDLLSRPASADEPAVNTDAAKSHFEQAATSVIAGAKESIVAASSDDEAMQRVQLSLEALRILGVLGEIDADAYTVKLMDELRSGSRPEIVDAIIQMRLATKLRQWNQMDSAAQTKAIDEFVASVKKGTLTAGPAKMLVQIANRLGDGKQSTLAAKAINDLLPAARESDDATVKRMIPLLEGIVRLIELPGKPMELEGKLLDGTELDWKSYRGKVVLVDFHASWCGPCRAEVPNILENYEAYHDKGFEVIGVNLDTERQAAEEYVKQTGFNFPTLFSEDPEASGWDQPMSRKYGITAIPRVILVDKDGIAVSTNARGEKLSDLLQQLLGAPGEPSADAAKAEATN